MTESSARACRTICLPFQEVDYGGCVGNVVEFRAAVDSAYNAMPELFPSEMANGYVMKDTRHSAKLDIDVRRIEIGGSSYTVRPAFAMPYMAGKTEEVEKPLFLRRFDVPFWALEYCFGTQAMKLFRMQQQLGQLNLVGTTVKDPAQLPDNLAADEKHTKLLGSKAFVATTVGNECILGAAIALNAGDKALTEAYGEFKQEAVVVDPDYAPKTVNTDGWASTVNAWTANFPGIACILCILHVFIKLRDRGKKKFKETFEDLATRLWHAYDATTKRSFSQRIRRLIDHAQALGTPDTMMKTLVKMRKRLSSYAVAYDHPGAHRTSNMLDRLMQYMDRYLFSSRYFHGKLNTATLGIRGWALIYNFAPSCPRTRQKHDGKVSPAERINGFRYSDVWLENLLICGSLQGGYRPPPNPL